MRYVASIVTSPQDKLVTGKNRGKNYHKNDANILIVNCQHGRIVHLRDKIKL